MHIHILPDFSLRLYPLHVFECMLLAEPSESIYEKVTVEKQAFRKRIGRAHAVITPPHITFAKFSAGEEVEGLLCAAIQKVCDLHHSFIVALNNFNGFWLHVIYIHVHNRRPFLQFAANLRKIEKLIPAHQLRITFLVDKPHMTIARQLERETYEEVIHMYKRLAFRDIFTLDKLVLLKRSSPGDDWRYVKEFYLPKERTLFN